MFIVIVGMEDLALMKGVAQAILRATSAVSVSTTEQGYLYALFANESGENVKAYAENVIRRQRGVSSVEVQEVRDNVNRSDE